MSDACSPAPISRCPNCDATGVGRYCPACGQKQRTGLPRVRDHLRELASDYVAVDGKLWRTLWLLIARPGVLDTDYVAGRRQRHIGPLKLYLSVSVAFFLLVALLPGAGITVQTDQPAEEARQASAPPPHPPGRAVAGTEARPDGRARVAGQIGERLNEHAPRAMFVLLPVFAALTRLAFLRRAQPYAAHLMLALHAHAMAFLLLIAAVVLPFEAADGLLLLLPVWLLFAFRRLFDGRWWALALRALFVCGVYALMLLGSIVGAVFLFATGAG